MFLLNRVEFTAKLLVNDFTSHYVPIKSVKRANNAEGELSLHPIMFLLNRSKSKCKNDTEKPLHPIMFLLNPDASGDKVLYANFTSHYVPIKSSSYNQLSLEDVFFTSHYVPIKSHTNIILYFLPFSTPFLSTPAKTSQADVHNLLNYLLTTLLTPHESMDCQLSHKNALS